ncbi:MULTISPECIES: flagellar basal-body MS-ring/collar protein FliF [unclassified Novosphingobium]|uniref:flagellar basal-body MS-ring/collar protein FliF n=1 Tax=unclassified Novosphingobium TaxID=2644732 RepID=UPI001441C57A|nr:MULTISPECIES: flagellar basal-body MS-ring/collar protein FliF [unclassified Novosphingobium]MBB3359443.1 flagellar M-ring protein FliF [Novosphingobium sp. BK256]MBB3375803.1 flagellar M-ring protein FliF [Novosphingobium sp. BK280]MBB3380216.1 flagellar M-ring protein FliF [Novosphingobium sp. BK258]MBB3421910.1 flagellar M-ring protein FliF [Novosphingobium sp. BK267]MBB3450566.1 flagellar M-ring protein FliF [Novosphingobium sp. BK352]
MADLVPVGAGGSPPPSLLAPLTDPAGGALPARMGAFLRQPPLRRMLPWFGGITAAGLTGLLWLTMAPAPQRMLYSDLSDAERAQVTAALDKAAIAYHIDNSTGAITVGENDLYKARMVAASDGAVATPETGEQMIDKLPMGASRTLEGQRLQAARERELELTIMQIDGVEAVRVHLAQPEKSVFVRDTAAPSASVMVRLAKGRQLATSQVSAIVNLVAGSVPELSVDAVKVIDQHGRLLSADKPGDADRLEIQGRLEDKLREQISQLLTPMLGEGNFSSEVQVDLDMDQVTSARESYDKQGAVRTEQQSASQTSGPGAVGVPGVLSNTPPAPTTAAVGAPQGTPSPSPSGAAPSNGESSSSKTYELGREVAVTNNTPGKIRRLTVAVALSSAVLAKAKPAEIDQIKQLVSAAVGADPTRGDQVAVAVRAFNPADITPPKFYEQPWFAMAVRNGVALVAVLLTLLLGVRPLIKALRRDGGASAKGKDARKKGKAAASEDDDEDAEEANAARAEGAADPNAPRPSREIGPGPTTGMIKPMLAPAQDETGAIDTELLSRQVGLAQRLVQEKPDSAVAVLRQMLKEPSEEGAS